MKQITAIISGLVAASAVLFAGAAAAQSCGVTGTNVASIGNYDPFSPSAISSVTTSVTLTRLTGTGGKKTQNVNFYFVKPAGSPAYQIIYDGSNVLYEAPGYAGAPILNVNNSNPTPGLVYVNFGGAAAPDTQTVNFTVTVPAGADLTAGGSIPFDIRYVCKGTGGMTDVSSPQTLTNAFSLNITVLSALQASYVGAALDFGEIGTLSTPTVLASPATYTRPGAVRVASSGPYSVELTSQNNFQLTAAGASTIDYRMAFLGQTRSNASPVFSPVNCLRAGVSGVNLPISVTLQEGGETKIPASSYSDNLSVTVTPLVVAGGAQNCPAL
ncbi:MAG: hypothetical protein U1E18_06885 [Brevundimonas sp.]|uniref:hypothetical protein n=1 Tax=Brevundimonas sp. TaxID=1871086 RepID=UPI002ABB089D|nr:hypothetical protein [Brevundimonas sp.]MDZ4109311.1 hypothetical protein [Brevundimonas sp.]